MNHNQIQQLKRLKLIEPDPSFLRKSRSLVLASRKSRPLTFFSPVWMWSGVAGVAVVVLAFAISMYFLPAKPVLSAALDPQSLSNELSNLTINIQLDEIKYDQSVNQTITSAITEIKDSSTSHLNGSILKNESDNLDLPTSSDEIDNTLDNLISN